MAAARNVPAPRRTPGYEPARGFPDPNFKREPEAPPAEGKVTHLPHRNGPACGATPVPTSAADYSPTHPTCAWCANYLKETQKATAAMYPSAPTTPPPATPKTGSTP